MSFFDEDDPFEDIVKEFFGGNPGFKSNHREIINGEADEREMDLIESDKKIFLIFSFPGYDKKDIDVKVHGGMIRIRARKSNISKVQNYLSSKLNMGVNIEKKLPKRINTKKFNYTFKDGILEVVFDKR